jgi:beta-glucosidase
MQFYDFPHTDFQHDIIESIKNGKLSKADLDRAVKDILRVKFMLGLFDNPYTDLKLVSKRFHTKEHSYLALEAARESIILLKNKNNVLPLKDVKIITLAGSLANTTYTGGYSPVGAKAISVYEALKEKFGNKIKINYLNNEISDKFCNISSTFLSRDIHSSTNDLKVEFFNNKNLNGAPSYSTTDANLNFYWHNLSPAPGINSENFSARWSGYISVPVSGKYEIDFRADDLGRVYINDQLFINHWDLKWQNRSEIKSIYLNSKQKIPFV